MAVSFSRYGHCLAVMTKGRGPRGTARREIFPNRGSRRVHVPAEHHERRPGARRPASTRRPPTARCRRRPTCRPRPAGRPPATGADPHPGRVHAARVDLPRADGQPHPGRATQERTRPASGCGPGRPCPLGTTATAAGPAGIPAAAHTARPVAGEERAKQLAQPAGGRRGRRRGDAIRLVHAEVLGQRPAAHRVPDRRDGIREQPASLAAPPVHTDSTGHNQPQPVPGKFGRTRLDGKTRHRQSPSTARPRVCVRFVGDWGVTPRG